MFTCDTYTCVQKNQTIKKSKRKKKRKRVKRNFLTAFDIVNNSRFFFSKLVLVPLILHYLVKYHTLSGEYFCYHVKRSLLDKKKERKKEKKKKIGMVNRRVFYGSVGRLAKGMLSASDEKSIL